MFGVSPAYFISRYTDRFTPAQVAAGLEMLKEIGYDAFQLEVFRADSLADWHGHGAERVATAVDKTGLEVTQFVAHFMIRAFESPAAIRSTFGLEEIGVVLSILSLFPSCHVVTVPVGEFRFPVQSREAGLDYSSLYEAFLEKLRRIAGFIEGSGRRCAIELIPGAIVNGSDGLLKLFGDLGSESVGYNFDTGHAHAAKENTALIPHKLRGRLLGTHLCDNNRNENLSLRPGAGSIAWPGVFEALQQTSYAGSLDIEIRCDEQQVAFEYRAALEFVRSNWHE